jgi:hypothetical protein
MSLYSLPVSVSDLIQLQFGLDFVNNTTEATSEAGLINQTQQTATVSSYAQQLIANNISLSQVAMAVDSLMFGVTDNVTELANLSVQFQPGQVANALKFGLNPTVYAAEALGLGLAGGNGTSNAFATDFGSLSVTQFASDVSGITGINAGAIQNFVQNWIKFYTANPASTFGLSVTLASYGAAFGDAVGAALLNPTVNGTLALLTSEVQNALIDNAEGQGLYQVGIPLIAEAPHLPLQGEAFPIPNAGGGLYGAVIDWAHFAGSAFDYAQFSSPQVGPLTILNAPGSFTLDTQHYGNSFPTGQDVIGAAGNGSLLTLILGNGTGPDAFGEVTAVGYPTVHIVAAGGTNFGHSDIVTGLVAPSGGQLVISGSGFLEIGDVSGAHVGTVTVGVSGGTITDVGVELSLGVTDAEMIDASNAPLLVMSAASLAGSVPGVTVLGGTSHNLLQGSLGGHLSTVTFSDDSVTGLSATIVGADNITGGHGGNDIISGNGGLDTIVLPSDHSGGDGVYFGVYFGADYEVLAITDGLDQAYPGFWGATVPTKIPQLFPSQNTGGTSADMSTVTGFRAVSGGDSIVFDWEAWNGDSTLLGPAQGDLVALNGFSTNGAAQLSKVWANSGSNSLLETGDNVLLYAPSNASLQNAQQLAAQLHTASDAVVLPGSGLSGFIGPSDDRHILVAYDASSNVNGTIQHAVNIADVDLVNMSTNNQSSTANLNVYASDMVHLVGVSLSNLTSDNIHFIQ